jgi:hypothetical protein
VRKAALNIARNLTQASAALAITAALIAIPTRSAHATEDDCDPGVPDTFSTVLFGGSVSAYGRTVSLENGDRTNESVAVISSDGYQRGDLVWVDRSLNPMPSSVPTFFTDDSYVTSRGGWKQCGPFAARSTGTVFSWNTDTGDHFAVRACFRPFDLRPSVCAAWYVDRSIG